MTETHDPRNIPLLTDPIIDDEFRRGPASFSDDAKLLQSAVISETLQLADSLLHQAVKDIEATLFERVFDRLRAELPELVDRILREHAPDAGDSTAST